MYRVQSLNLAQAIFYESFNKPPGQSMLASLPVASVEYERHDRMGDLHVVICEMCERACRKPSKQCRLLEFWTCWRHIGL